MGRTLVGGAALAFLLYAGGVCAQGYPTKPIRFVVPFGTVGVPDLIARVIAKRLGENAGWQVFVDNRPGADFGKEKIVMIKLIAVLDGSAVHLGRHAAGVNQRRRVE